MPALKKTRFLTNLKVPWGPNLKEHSKKRKLKEIEDQENIPPHHAPKTARPLPSPNSVHLAVAVCRRFHAKRSEMLPCTPPEAPGIGRLDPTTWTVMDDNCGNHDRQHYENTPDAGDVVPGAGMLNETAAMSESSDEEGDISPFQYEKLGTHIFPPSIAEAKDALEDIKKVLKPPRKKGAGYDHPDLDQLTSSRVEAMKKFLWKYVNGNSTKAWIRVSLETAHDHERGAHHARLLREWSRAFLANRNDLPRCVYGTWKTSMLDDEDFAQAIHLHLQSLGPYIRAQDVVDFVKLPQTMAQFKLKKPISLATAQRWMKRLGYRWTTTPSGQYVDGHERRDVVDYRQKCFLPRWMGIEERTRKWTEDRKEEDVGERPHNRRVVVWFHDESTFYANDRRKLRWVHKSETAVPRAKGEGASLMVADFVSADYVSGPRPDRTPKQEEEE